jgi:hypothetical protein
MGEVIQTDVWQANKDRQRQRQEAERKRSEADEARALRLKQALDAKEDRLDTSDRERIARNLGSLVAHVSQALSQPDQKTLRDLYEAHNPDLLPKRRRHILLKGETPPKGEPLVATLPLYRQLATTLAHMHPRAHLGQKSIENNFQYRLVRGTSLSVEPDGPAGNIDADAIGGAIDLLQEATRLVNARVPRLVGHFEGLAKARLLPSVKSLDFGSGQPAKLEFLGDGVPHVCEGDQGEEDGILTLTGPSYSVCLSEDEYGIQHHWPSTRLGSISATIRIPIIDELDPDLRDLADAIRSHLGPTDIFDKSRLDLGTLGYAGQLLEQEENHAHIIGIAAKLDALAVGPSLSDGQYKAPIEVRSDLHLCAYPTRVNGRTDCRLGLYLTLGSTPKIGGYDDEVSILGAGQNVFLIVRDRLLLAVRQSDFGSLGAWLGDSADWDMDSSWVSTAFAPLDSEAAATWLGGSALSWAMTEEPRRDRFSEGVVLRFEPAFDVPSAPASAPLATPAGMVERNILHASSADDVIGRLIGDAEARIAWLDELQKSWAELHLQARAAFSQTVQKAIAKSLDGTDEEN